jgi:hypothetical protein
MTSTASGIDLSVAVARTTHTSKRNLLSVVKRLIEIDLQYLLMALLSQKELPGEVSYREVKKTYRRPIWDY